MLFLADGQTGRANDGPTDGLTNIMTYKAAFAASIIETAGDNTDFI